MKFSYITTAWLVLMLALVFGTLLAGVQIRTKPMIDANRRYETYSQVPVLIQGADPESITEQMIGGLKVYRAVDEAGRLLGWVAKASGRGYGDVIELLIGLDGPAETITGLYVLSQIETPGLGEFITSKDWRSQFAGVSYDPPLVVVKTTPSADNEVEAITGATVSSESVVVIANRAIADVRRGLAERPDADGGADGQ